MPRAPRAEIHEKDISGLKHFARMQSLLGRLHQVGCQRDTAGNRELYFDQYCLLILLHLFNPIITSLRGLQQASGLKKVQKKLGVGRASLGSLSESVQVFDPEPLKQIAGELAAQIPQPAPGEFSAVNKSLTAVDGSVFDTIARVAQLAWLPKSKDKRKHAYRLHTQFEVLRGVPARIDVTPGKPKGEADERAVLKRTLEPDRCYITDRGYAKFALWNEIVGCGSSYVCRARDNSVYDVLEERTLSDADREQGVLSDQVVRLGLTGVADARPNHPVRLVIVEAVPHMSRGKYRGGSSGPSTDGRIRLATNMLDVPAELISKLYRLRWLIELFFRMFKGLLGCRHLLSTKQNGVEIHAYLAIIACLLILIYTGRTPTKRTFEMICLYLSGWADLEELEAHIAGLRPASPLAA